MSLQEQPLTGAAGDPRRRPGPVAAVARAGRRRGRGHAASLLGQARRPLFLLGRLSRDEQDWDRRVALAERYGALVISDLKNGAVFPTAHPLHPDPPGIFLPAAAARLIGAADLIVSLDWVDLAGTISPRPGLGHPASARIISCTTDSALHNGWSKDSFGREPVDLTVPADPDLLVRALLESDEPGQAERVGRPGSAGRRRRRGATAAPTSSCTTWPQRCATPSADDARLPGPAAARLGRRRPRGRPSARLPGPWTAARASARGRGWRSGAALALEGSGRLPVAVLGDGDFLMGGTAIWTAAHYRLPLLIVVANNSFFFNDVVHQERVAGAAPAAGRELLDRPGHHRPGPGPGGVRPLARLPGRRPGPRPLRSCPPRWPPPSPPPAPASACWSTSGSAPTATPPSAASARGQDQPVTRPRFWHAE